MALIKLNQQNSLGQELYLKFLPPTQVVPGNETLNITEEELLEKKANLTGLIAEIDEDLAQILLLK